MNGNYFKCLSTMLWSFAKFWVLLAAKMPEGSERDRKSTRLNSSHIQKSRMPSSA